MFTRGLLLAVPSMAMAVVGVAMVGPGAVQAFDGARIRGGPAEGQRSLSWRITVLQRFRSIDSTRNIGSVVVQARDGAGHDVIARCRTRGDGTCDVELDFTAPVTGPIHALVTAEASGATLARGELGDASTAWGVVPGHPAELKGSASGDLTIAVYARRGVLAAPFRDEVTVSVRDGEGPLRGARVTLRADGADLDGGTTPEAGRNHVPPEGSPPRPMEAGTAETAVTVVSSERGEATFGITPKMHAVDADIEIDATGRGATWHGMLPIIPGAIWLDPAPVAAGKLRVVAPVPRELAYATLATENARLWGGIIPLSADARGFAAGEIDWPAAVHTRGPRGSASDREETMWLTLSSDPLASGAGTVGWPVPGDTIRDERPFRDLLLLDGMPAAEKRDQDRRYRARALSAVALGAAAVLEGVLLAQSSRARGLRAWAWTALAIATVALAFAAIGVVVMWKTSG